MVAILSPGTTYGKILQCRAVSGFTFKEVVYPPDLEVPPHAHEQATLYVVLQGIYTEVYKKITLTPKPFGLAFHPANEVHSHRCPDEGGRCFVVEVGPRWMERVREYTRILDEPTDLQRGLAACLAMRLYREFKQDDGVAPLVMEGLALETLAEASRRPVRGTVYREPLFGRHCGGSWRSSNAPGPCVPSALPLHAGGLPAPATHRFRVPPDHSFRCSSA